MNKKLFIDSDIILDVLAERGEFYASAAEIFDLGYAKEAEYLETNRII